MRRGNRTAKASTGRKHDGHHDPEDRSTDIASRSAPVTLAFSHGFPRAMPTTRKI